MNQTNYHVKVWLDKQMLRAETMSKHMFSEIDSQLVVKLREREGHFQQGGGADKLTSTFSEYCKNQCTKMSTLNNIKLRFSYIVCRTWLWPR